MSHSQINPSVTNPSIADVYNSIMDGGLIVAPDFQRRFVWTQQHQEEFIETILKGYPFPEIYVCKGETSLNEIKTSKKVIDGQQRLTTLKNYIDGVLKDKLKIIKPFSELNGNEREFFLEYQIVIRDLGRLNETDIREIFRRINLTKFKLDDVEIQNAIYDGAFISAAKELAETIELGPYDVFLDSEITRMSDVHFFLSILSTIEVGGYFNRDVEIEKCVIQYNERYDNKEQQISRVVDAFSVLDSLKLDLDSIWFRKSNFYTLIVELSLGNLEGIDNLADRLKSFESKILQNKHQPNIYGEYYSAMYSGTNNRKSRVTRSSILQQYLKGEISD